MRILLVSLLFVCTPVFAADFQDIWWDATKPGMGIIVGQQGIATFVTWFTYDASGKGVWYLFTGNLQITVANGVEQQTISGPLQQFNGTPPTQYNPAAETGQTVGSATLTFTSPVAGTLNYTLNGVGGSMNLQHYGFASVLPDGSYTGTVTATSSGCSYSSNNGNSVAQSLFTISTNGNSIMLQETLPGGTCTYSGQYSQAGTKYIVSSNFNCSNGAGGTWSSTDLNIHDIYLTGQFVQQYTSGETCSIVGELALINGTAQPAASKKIGHRPGLN
jgi:hypothetical protein